MSSVFLARDPFAALALASTESDCQRWNRSAESPVTPTITLYGASCRIVLFPASDTSPPIARGSGGTIGVTAASSAIAVLPFSLVTRPPRPYQAQPGHAVPDHTEPKPCPTD